MSVELARGALGRARKYPSFVVIQVKNASDPEVARSALDGLHRAFYPYFRDIWVAEGGNPVEVPTPSVASGGIPAPGGPMLWSDCGVLPDQHLKTWLQFVRAHLEAHGVDHAVVDVVKSDIEIPEDTAWAFEEGRNVFLWATTKPWDGRLFQVLVPEADRFGSGLNMSVPPGWRWALTEFMADAADDTGNVILDIAGEDMAIPPDAIAELLAAREQIVTRRQKDLEDIPAPAGFSFFDPGYASEAPPATIKIAHAENGIQLTICALPDVDPETLADAMVGLRGQARKLEPPPHAAFVATGHRFSDSSGPVVPVDRPDGAQLHLAIFEDTLFDAYWYQIIGRPHVDRLGGPPHGAAPLDAEHWELTVGEPEEWLDPETVPRMRAEARELLGACLLTGDEADQYWDELSKPELLAQWPPNPNWPTEDL